MASVDYNIRRKGTSPVKVRVQARQRRGVGREGITQLAPLETASPDIGPIHFYLQGPKAPNLTSPHIKLLKLLE